MERAAFSKKSIRIIEIEQFSWTKTVVLISGGVGGFYLLRLLGERVGN